MLRWTLGLVFLLGCNEMIGIEEVTLKPGTDLSKTKKEAQEQEEEGDTESPEDAEKKTEK